LNIHNNSCDSRRRDIVHDSTPLDRGFTHPQRDFCFKRLALDSLPQIEHRIECKFEALKAKVPVVVLIGMCRVAMLTKDPNSPASDHDHWSSYVFLMRAERRGVSAYDVIPLYVSIVTEIKGTTAQGYGRRKVQVLCIVGQRKIIKFYKIGIMQSRDKTDWQGNPSHQFVLSKCSKKLRT
jgi:hypothetical protein